MKIQPKYIKGIFYGAGVLILLIVIAWIKPSMDDKHDQLQATNDQLSAQLSQLEELEANAANYEAQAKVFEEEDQNILNEFPAEVRPEDVILYAKQIENKSDMRIANIGVTQGNLVYAMNAAPAAEAAPVTDETTDDGTADAQPAAGDATADAAAAPENTLGILDEAAVVKPDYNLFQMSVSYDITSSYRDLKEIVEDILDDVDKQNVSGISLAFDSETGQLVGTMNLNRYYLTGTEKQYENPDAGNIKKGSNNIFGTIEAPQAE